MSHLADTFDPTPAAVLGDRLDPSRLDELRSGLSVELDGQEVARTLSGEDATDPEAALADLIALAAERKMVLPKGSIISTGTVSKPFNVAAPAADIRARFPGAKLAIRTQVIRRNAA